MTRTLLTGATGTLGTALRSRLIEAGHSVRAASRSPPRDDAENLDWVALDVTDDADVETAVEGVDVVVHTATAPQGDTQAVDVRGTERLLEAADAAGVEHFVYPSIVGVDDIPFTYYEHKRAAETAVADSDVPSTIVRATQFHSFVADVFDSLARLPVWPVPRKLPLQPVAVGEVAAVLAEHATGAPRGRTDPVGGPEIHSARELAQTYRESRGSRRPIVGIPIPGATAAGFRAGHATCPSHRVGTVTWQGWLSDRPAEAGTEPETHTKAPR